jgi:hypothetical protein
MRRSRSRRRRRLGDATGDPLDGLVNLFDVGIVLAIAFLIAGLAAKVDSRSGRLEPRTPSQAERQERSVPTPSESAPARGRGKAVGTVYRLDDGRLIYTDPNTKQP